MLRFKFLTFIFITVGMFLLFNINIKELYKEIIELKNNFKISKKRKNLKQLIFEAKKIKHNNIVADFINKTKFILIKENNLSSFKNIYIYSAFAGIIGVVIAIIIQNIFLIPILFILFASFPFLYIQINYNNKRKRMNKDLESAVSNITYSYTRDNMSIVESVKENINFIKEPLKQNFEIFLYNYENINSNIKENLEELKSKIDNLNFEEWVDTIIQSIDDSNYKNALSYIVNKFSDERIINMELSTKMYEPMYEYILTVILTILSIPFTLFVGEGWYEILTDTFFGKFMIALIFTTILISTIAVVRILKPAEYRA